MRKPFRATHWLKIDGQPRVKVRREGSAAFDPCYIAQNGDCFVGIPDECLTPFSRQAIAAQNNPIRVKDEDRKRPSRERWAQVDWCKTDNEIAREMRVTSESVCRQRKMVGVPLTTAYEIRGLRWAMHANDSNPVSFPQISAQLEARINELISGKE
jgi:hypothetical protein